MTLSELKDKRSKHLVDMQAIAVKGFNTESRTAFDAMNTEVTAIEADIARSERVAAIEADNRSFTRSPRPLSGVTSDGFDSLPVEERKKKYSRTFQQYAVRGSVHAVDAEYRTLLTTWDWTGGALVPQIFSGIFGRCAEVLRPHRDEGPSEGDREQRRTDEGIARQRYGERPHLAGHRRYFGAG